MVHRKGLETLRSRSAKPSRAALIRAAFYCSRPSKYKNNPNPAIWFGLFFFGTPEGTRLHFRLWRKLRFGSVEPSPATVPRTVAFDCSSPPLYINKRRSEFIIHSVFYWYTGRDSNPQPSEPESDALSIEPPVHLLHSLDIIAGFSGFVKREGENIFPFLRHFSR